MNENGNPRVPIQEVDDNLNLPNFTSNLGVIPTSYKDSMDFYETLNWLVKYLEDTIIPAVNEDIEAVEELEKLFEELRAYVDTFSEAIASKQPMITQDNPLASDLVSTANQINKFVTQAQLILINTIPNKEDVANRVEEITEYSTNTEYPTAKAVYDLSLLKENIANKVTALTSESTDTQYPSAKAVYDQLLLKEDIANKVNTITNASTNTQYPSAKAVYDVSENLNSLIDDIYNVLPRVSGTGSTVTLNDTAQTRLDIIPIGKCEQDSTTGKNKFPLPNTETKNGVTFTKNNDGTFNINGTASANTDFQVKIDSTLASGNYTLSKNKGGTDLRILVEDYNGSTWVAGLIGVGTSTYENERTANISPTGDSTMFTVEVLSGVTINLQNVEVQLESGSSKTDFEKFTGGIPSPNPDYPQNVRVVTGDNDVVVQNKNLLNSIFTQTSTKNNVTATPNADGSISLSGTATATTFFNLSGYHWDNIDFSSVNDRSEIYKAVLIDTISGITLTYTYVNSITSLRITSGTNCNNVKVYPMIIKKPVTDETFVKHAEQKVTLHLGTNYMAGIDDYKDEIVGKTDDWKIRRYVGKVVFNGTENWSINNTGTENFYYRYRYISNNRYTGGSGTFLCNEFSFAQVGNSTTDEGMFITQVGEIRVRFGTEMTIEDFKTWLSTHNIILYYQLETPTEEPIIDQTLISDLNNMYNLMGYDGQTNISFIPSSGNAQGELYVSTLKKIS